MIKAQFLLAKDGTIRKLTLKGHADSGEYGHDIVCAAVSAVTIGAANGIEHLTGFDPVTAVDAIEGGHLTVAIPTTLSPDAAHTAQILLESLRFSLGQIQATSADYLSVTTNHIT
ncbi:ribosomal-processing cysteine protease Prp [Lacticaseibacillus kribbianus]|uniref:ribosomal-processing cysteine protease Prp n=1 Tax=Lacticaseibacillus kribbianus TaxID=2926292 RepID=UPI001CD7BE58|nr:ribosomal-processing cysteine protease Prp [Lacticaseibacillus kribbianus]